MRRYGMALLMLVIVGGWKHCAAQNESEPAGDRPSLTVRVTGLAPQGELKVAVFNESATFPQRDKATLTKTVPISKEQASVCFEQMPPGNYAVAIFQDVNKDGKLNKSGFGVPIEPYGFSNNARGNFGPPPFQKAAFTIAKDSEVDITLR